MPGEIEKQVFEHTEGVHVARDQEKTRTTHGLILIPQPSSDPHDPLNWPRSKKLLTLGIVSFASCINLGQSLANQAGLVPQALLYHVSPVEISYSLSAAVAGSIVGPLIWAPLSQYLGRSSLIFWGSVITIACNIWSACMTKEDQYIPFVMSRLLSGIFSTTSLTLGAGILLDIFFLHQRGKAFACYTITALMGPLIAPVTSGFITESAPWPIQFWWCVGAVGLVAILVFFFLEDTTYDRSNPANNRAPQNYIARRVATFFPGNKILQQRTRTPFSALYKIALCPQALMTGCALLLTFGWVVGLNTTLAVFLQTPVALGGYGFSPSQNASFVFTQWVSLAVAEVYGFLLNDRVALWLCRRRGGSWKPEYRLLPVLIPPMIALPVGLILFGVGLQYHLHYMVLATGLFLATFADMAIVPVANNYLAENFHDYAVETFTILWVWRLSLGVAVPFFIIEWVELNGPGWVFGTMAILSTLGMGILALLAWKGQQIRQYSFGKLIGTEEGEKVVATSTSHEGE
ncbi:hypothetical protein H2200_001768 [Cladophialophora chaetospira]|uniref:Major facilitator superfamily (MFS) profile domain-containing protein n=1 Tax=Cladophialophora chaetospira TaxID=386627 RepID=A0AA38XLI9_9EURO|nr:hypothetical protein H2200_001768 [Cladophialophora chaetospira]